MEVKFKGDFGEVTWKLPAKLVKTMREMGINPRRQVKIYEQLFGDTAEMMFGLFEAICYGVGTPEEVVDLLQGVDEGIQRAAKKQISRSN